MGAGASDTGKDKDLKGQQEDVQLGHPKARNYVPISCPPQYDLTFDSTDSEITELEEERKQQQEFIAIPLPPPPVQPFAQRRSSFREIVSIQEESHEESIPGESREGGHEEVSYTGEEIPEEQVTLGRLEEEQTPFPESVEEEVRVTELDDVPRLTEEQEPEVEAETEPHPTVAHEESRHSTITPQLPVLQVVHPGPVEEEETEFVSAPVRRRSRCNRKGICTRPDICKLKRCLRQVSFANQVQYCINPNCPRSQKSSSHEAIDDYDGGYDYYYSSEEDLGTTHDGFIYSRQINRFAESDEEGEEVMPDYQRYSREQPEKDPNSSNGKKGADSGNMRDCCRPCCPNRTVSLKHNNLQQQQAGNSNGCRCNNQGNRHTSESYVSCRGQSKNPAHSKSAPNQLEERDSYSNFQGADNQRPLPPRRSSFRPQPPPRRSKPRSYPPGHNLEGRGDQERPHIPLPPPPQHFSAEQPLVPPHQHEQHHQPRNSRDSRDLRDSRDSRHPSGPRDTRDSRDTSEQPPIEEQERLEERKEMYSHNTKRNYVTKKPFNHSYNHNRQALKPYPYEEPGGSTTYSHESTCSNNCSGYEHCPMHHACRCQCLCMNDEPHYCPQTQSDDQMSYCSDSSNSEYMNLAYQRTGDYPELMDELENTLSHRNRMRVQKTMQRFEMLSRQNKNLEKPIFEDEESLRQYNMGMHAAMNRDKHDRHECKCRHCEEKHHRQNYNTRSEALAKRPNYQPTPFPRNSGYVEKVARYMDPNLNNMNNRRESNPRKKMDDRHEMPTTLTNSNGTWQMDARKNEWVKVDNGHPGNQNQYDFENSYPPLPPRPISEHMYDRRNYQQERGPCSCTKCLRRR